MVYFWYAGKTNDIVVFDNYQDARNLQLRESGYNVYRSNHFHKTYNELMTDQSTIAAENIKYDNAILLKSAGRGGIQINLTKDLHAMGIDVGDNIWISVRLK